MSCRAELNYTVILRFYSATIDTFSRTSLSFRLLLLINELTR
jgi:hypothetical protein